MESKVSASSVTALLANLKSECERAPKFGRNGKALVLEAARAIARLEDQERAERVAAAAARLALAPAPAAKPARSAAPTTPARLSPAQLLALVPTAARPFLPYQPRACLPLAERQGVVDRLLGLHLRALLRALNLPDAAVEAGGGAGAGTSSKSTKARALQGSKAAAAAASGSAASSPHERRARLIWRAAADAAVAQEGGLYRKHASKPAYMAATLNLEADVALWEEEGSSEAVAELRKMVAEAGAGTAGAAATAAPGTKRRRREEEEQEDGDEDEEKAGGLPMHEPHVQ